MLLALLLTVAGIADWVPARWQSADPQSVNLIAETPINCVLIERANWSADFVRAAATKGIASVAVMRPDAPDSALATAAQQGFTGIVIEGPYPPERRAELAAAAEKAGLKVIHLAPRVEMDVSGKQPIVGTYQGVWPGVHTAEDGTAKAAPTGAPWIDTNNGFLRFVRAATDATVWIGNGPPEGEVIPFSRYLQAVGDAAMVGARWVVALDSHFTQRLLAGDEEAVKNWRSLGKHLRFWEQHRAWTLYPPAGGLAVIQDAVSGALLSGGILDMITARHTPLRAVPSSLLQERSVEGARMAVNVNPRSLSESQQQMLRGFARGGATLLTAPPGWAFPPQRIDQITVDEKEVAKLDDIWRGVNGVVGRDNLGVRLFNVATMRSELVAAPEGDPTILHLVNYSDYPVENITIRPLMKYTKATLYAPGKEPAELEIYENGELDVEEIESYAIIALSGPTGAAPAGGH